MCAGAPPNPAKIGQQATKDISRFWRGYESVNFKSIRKGEPLGVTQGARDVKHAYKVGMGKRERRGPGVPEYSGLRPLDQYALEMADIERRRRGTLRSSTALTGGRGVTGGQTFGGKTLLGM